MKRLLVICVALALLAALVAGCKKPGGEKAAVPDPAKAADPQATNSAAPGGQTQLTVFVPCGMIIPFKTVMDAYAAKHTDVKFVPKFDNGGILVKKILEQGAQCDLFVSPGPTELNKLVAAGKADDTTRKAVGKYELVIITQHGNPLGITKPEDLLKCKTVSCPDPDVNSVGAFGKQALTKLGIWDKLQDKFLKPFPEHAIDSHTAVANGKSDAGISYKNCPLETNPEKLARSKVAIGFTFDQATYDPAECLIAVMKDSPAKTQAQAFIDWLVTPEAQQMLAKTGLPGATVAAAAGTKS